jgi:hypothetical protein
LQAPTSIRAFQFNPANRHALVIGCTNGELIKVVMDPLGVSYFAICQTRKIIWFVPQPGGDFYGVESVDGFIHVVAIDDEGNQIAVAFAANTGMHVKIFTLSAFRKTDNR